MKITTQMLRQALQYSVRYESEGIRVHRENGDGNDHFYVDDEVIYVFSAGRGWCDQKATPLANTANEKEYSAVISALWKQRKYIYSVNGNQFRD